MFKQKVLYLFLVMIALTLAACGVAGDEEEDFGERHNTGFQLNGPVDPDDQFPYFKLTEVFDGRGALEDAWDSIDGPTFNSYLTKTVDDYTDPFIVFSKANAKVLGGESGLMTFIFGHDIANLLDYLTDGRANTDATVTDIGRFYTQSGEVYQQGFYSLLDELYKDGENSGKMEFPAIGRKIINRMLDKKTAADLHADMEELVEDVIGEDFNKDFKDLHEVLGKLVVRADYPLWVDPSGTPLDKNVIDPDNSEHSNTGIGNAVQGVFNQAKWVNQMLKSTAERGYFHDLVNEVTSLFNPSPASLNSLKIKKLLENIEDNFTKEGSGYNSNALYSTDDATIYSDAELGNTIRELLPGSLQLMLRSDRLASLIGNEPGSDTKYVLREMTNNLKALQFDPETQNIEKSLINLMKYDVWGLDRTDTESGASPTSFLESLLFITQVSSNIGWKDRGEALGDSDDEIRKKDEDDPFDEGDARYEHGHGYHTGSLTLNDSLFSLKTHSVQGSLGIFDISLKETDGDYRFRSKTPFDLNGSDSYQFHYDQDYDVLNMLAGPGVGDFGASDGGNPDGEVPAFNGYAAYSPDGRSEKTMSAWTLGWVARACFNGEGPYYYADPEVKTVSFNDETWKRYLRPNGKTYALVSDANEYFYPSEGADPEDEEPATLKYNGRKQRYNRYKSEWKTDYYLAKYIIDGNPLKDGAYGVRLNQDNAGNVALEIGDRNGNFSATSLTYKELISEIDPLRACKTPEEALFRNYQWLMTEKKMVIVMPLVIDMNVPINPEKWGIDGDVYSEVIAFQVLEANGMSGLTNLRKSNHNHQWAKKRDGGISTIPGDYRIEVVSSDTSDAGATTDYKIYNNTLDCGTATPAVVAHNIPALYRFGFPIDRTLNLRTPEINDMEVGSKDFTVGANDKWANRNAVLMPFISLVAAIYNNTPEKRSSVKAGLKSFVEGTSPLIKPLVYFQKDGGQYPRITWKPMVRGGEAPDTATDWTDYIGDDFLRSSADFHEGNFQQASCWDGTAAEKAYYQPAVVKTLLNVLIDSDITAISDVEAGYNNSRMDGVLPMLAETKTITALLKSLMSDANDSDLIYSSLEQINGALKFTKGRMTEINQEESYKQIAFPDWMFATGVEETRDVVYGAYTEFTGVRAEDIIIDRGIDRLLGHKAIDSVNDGYGLSAYVAEQRSEIEPWNGFYETVDMLEDFLHPDSPYSIVKNVLNINDALFARERSYEDIEIAGLLYAVGKLLTSKNESGNWVSQGESGFDDVLKLITERFPQIHDAMKDENGFSGDNYHSMLVVNSDILKENGLAEYMVGALSTKENFEAIFSDVNTFINDPVVTEMNPLWLTLSDLLNDMATVLEITKDGDELDAIYQDFGFQQN